MTSLGPRATSVMVEERSAGRWCAECREHGSHHTDRHAEFVPAAAAPDPTGGRPPARRRARHRVVAIALCGVGLLGMATTLARIFTLLADVELRKVVDLVPFTLGFIVLAFIALEWLDWAEAEAEPTGTEA